MNAHEINMRKDLNSKELKCPFCKNPVVVEEVHCGKYFLSIELYCVCCNIDFSHEQEFVSNGDKTTPTTKSLIDIWNGGKDE